MPEREFLVFHNLFDKWPECLAHRNDDVPGIKNYIFSLKGIFKLINPDPMLHQEIYNVGQFTDIMLLSWHNVVIGRFILPFHNFNPGKIISEFQNIFIMYCSGLNDRHGSGDLIIHDIRQTPPSAFPGQWHVYALLIFREAFAPD